jgi:glycosyltransferase involved in cell wall biosynthesis
MAYSLAELQERRHFQFFEARHSGGYFDKVIGVHPLADRVASIEHPIERKRFSDRQDVIEAKSTSAGLGRWLMPLDFAISQRRLLDHLEKVVRTEHVDMIAATDPLYGGLLGLWLKRRTGLPLVIHLIANYELNYERLGQLAMPKMFPTPGIERRVISYVMRRSDLIAAGSETARDYAVRLGVVPGRTDVFKVSKNMVPAHRIAPGDRQPLTAQERQRLCLGDAEKLLLTVARLEPVKMVDQSIRAFSIVVRDHPDALLLLAGQGNEREALEKLAQELSVADRVRFLGLVDQDLLSRLVPGCLVLSPLTGMALHETSMGGAPAVAYGVDASISEVVENDVTGYLVELGEWKAMGEAASRILSDKVMFERMSKAIRQRAEQLTDEGALYAHEAAAFDRLLGTAKRQRRPST